MTPEELIVKARALAEKATPGPWIFRVDAEDHGHVDDDHGCPIALIEFGETSNGDAQFIAESRALVPQLADALEAALVLIRQSRDELDDAMRDVDPSVSWAPIRSRFNAFLARMGGGT